MLLARTTKIDLEYATVNDEAFQDNHFRRDGHPMLSSMARDDTFYPISVQEGADVTFDINALFPSYDGGYFQVAPYLTTYPSTITVGCGITVALLCKWQFEDVDP